MQDLGALERDGELAPGFVGQPYVAAMPFGTPLAGGIIEQGSQTCGNHDGTSSVELFDFFVVQGLGGAQQAWPRRRDDMNREGGIVGMHAPLVGKGLAEAALGQPGE